MAVLPNMPERSVKVISPGATFKYAPIPAAPAFGKSISNKRPNLAKSGVPKPNRKLEFFSPILPLMFKTLSINSN